MVYPYRHHFSPLSFFSPLHSCPHPHHSPEIATAKVSNDLYVWSSCYLTSRNMGYYWPFSPRSSFFLMPPWHHTMSSARHWITEFPKAWSQTLFTLVPCVISPIPVASVTTYMQNHLKFKSPSQISPLSSWHVQPTAYLSVLPSISKASQTKLMIWPLNLDFACGTPANAFFLFLKDAMFPPSTRPLHSLFPHSYPCPSTSHASSGQFSLPQGSLCSELHRQVNSPLPLISAHSIVSPSFTAEI